MSDVASVSNLHFLGLSGTACAGLSSVAVSPVTNLNSGCFRVTYSLSGVDEYTLRYWTSVLVTSFASRASDPGGAFTMAIPPYSPAGPSYTWLLSPGVSGGEFSAWRRHDFPQSAWKKQDPECVAGQGCPLINIAPSERYEHSAVVYDSWNFESDVAPHATLCKLPTVSNSACTESCLSSDISCTGATSWTNFFSTVSDHSFWTSASLFGLDDGFQQPVSDTVSSSCPSGCCGERRMCLRTRDNLGQIVPFDESFMLIFGGQTRQKTMISIDADDSEDLYSNCEALLAGGTLTDQKYNGCMQFISEELWRFSVSSSTWDLLKPISLQSDESLPYARFAHAATLQVIPASEDLQNTKRQYMYIFGGFSTSCSGSNGICQDLWRFEIPWAAQAYWPTPPTTRTFWNRGNTWKRLSDAPFGVYRHSMQLSADGSQLLVFGGEKGDATYSSTLLIYSIASDTWIVKDTLGYLGFQRSGKSYMNTQVTFTSTDMSAFIKGLDTAEGPSVGGFKPYTRSDHCSSILFGENKLMILNGFRTTTSAASGSYYPTYPYYLGDVWTYSLGSNVWEEIFFKDEEASPSPRRGAACTILTDDSNLLVVSGGYRGDRLLGDFWTLDTSTWSWNRHESVEISSPNMAYHSIIFDKRTNQFIVFGGLTWTESDLNTSDQINSNDRTCSMNALNLLSATCTNEQVVGGNFGSVSACALADQKNQIASKCALSSISSTFCCKSINQFSAVNSLASLSALCASECQTDAFTTEYTASFLNGIYFFNPAASCPNSCSSNGICDMGLCACSPGFTGSDCSLPLCDGSFCFIDSQSLQTQCVYCSGNGQCPSSGACACNEGWTGSDCSQGACADECLEPNGVCLSDEFPLNQCVCSGAFSGSDCSKLLCLNNCTSSGACNPNGTCSCSPGFAGPDCSVYLFTASAITSDLTLVWSILLLSLTLLLN